VRVKERILLVDLDVDGRLTIKTDIRKMECEGVDWIHNARGLLVGCCE
jgi:hypothetical protein